MAKSRKDNKGRVLRKGDLYDLGGRKKEAIQI